MRISENSSGGFRDCVPPMRAATVRRLMTCCSRKVVVLLVAVAAALMLTAVNGYLESARQGLVERARRERLQAAEAASLPGGSNAAQYSDVTNPLDDGPPSGAHVSTSASNKLSQADMAEAPAGWLGRNSFPACGTAELDSAAVLESGEGSKSKQPPRSFVFNELSASEIKAVSAFVAKHFDLWIGSGYPDPENDFVAQVEVLPLPKAEAVAWLDSAAASDTPMPHRFARATVMRGAVDTPNVQEYKVGPVAAIMAGSTPIEVQALWGEAALEWIKHPFGHWSMKWIRDVVSPVGYELRQLFRNATGSNWCYGDPAENTQPKGDTCGFRDFAVVPFQNYSPPGKRWTHIKFLTRMAATDVAHMFPLPLTMTLDETSPDLSKWTLFNFEYCSQGPFDTAAELLAAVDSGEVTHCGADWGHPEYDLSWASTLQQPLESVTKVPKKLVGASDSNQGGKGEHSRAAFEAKASARTFMPHGSRITTETSAEGTGGTFAWGEWSGHAKVVGTSGLSLHDLRFRGERILYELALQELQVVYNGFGGGGQIFIMDSYIGIGSTSEALQGGSDCPADATFVPVMAASSQWNLRAKPIDAMCLFEEDAAMTEWRHSTPRFGARARVDGVRRVSLVIRTCATVGNYDYVADVRLRLDGSVDVSVTAGGYMSTVFWQDGVTAEEAAFGTVVSDNLLAPLHDHFAGWKVDIDVLGSQNTFQTQTIRVGSYEEALKASEAVETATKQHLVHGVSVHLRRQPTVRRPRWHSAGPNIVKYVETKQPGVEVGMRSNSSAPAVWQFLAANSSRNAFGQRRGYAISMSGGKARQLLPDDHPLLRAAAWSKYHCAVTRQKDSEPHAVATRLDCAHPGDAVVSLDSFLDGESTNDADLVAWVSFGLQHLPRSEDVPVVTNMGAGFSIKPWNYFDGLPTHHLRDASHSRKCAPRVDGPLPS